MLAIFSARIEEIATFQYNAMIILHCNSSALQFAYMIFIYSKLDHPSFHTIFFVIFQREMVVLRFNRNCLPLVATSNNIFLSQSRFSFSNFKNFSSILLCINL